MSWKDRVKANEESGINAKLRAEAAGNLYSAMRDYAATSGQYKDQGQRDQFERNLSEYESIVNRLGSSGVDITGQDEVIKSFRSFHGDTSKIYSQFKNRGEYDAAVKAQKDYTALLGFDTKAGQQEVDKLEKYLRKAKSLTPAGHSVKEGTGVTVNRNTQALNSYLKSVGFSSVDELEKAISDKRLYLAQAKRTQNKSKLDSDADNDKEFKYYSALGADMENPTAEDASPSIKVFGWEKGGSKVKNKVAYSRDNYDELMRRSASSVANGGGYSDSNFNADYMEMTDDEVNKYNYYLAKYGDEKADEYLDSLTETLSYRKATKGFRNVEGKTAEELAFSIISGLDQFASGLGSIFSSEDYIPPSAVQMQSSLVREDLADKGPDIFGSSLGQTVYDLGTTTANMLPSIAVGTLVGMVNPIAGKVAGDALMGASAAGNAYTEMLNLGYDKSQARAYGTITGALEAGLQYLLGGIGALGGEISGKAISKAVEGINNGAAKFAIKFGGEMASEGIEEALQEVLSPILKNAIFNTDESIDWEQVAYSGLLGAMSAGLFNSSNAVTNTVRMNNANKELYGSNLRDLVAESLELNPDNKLAKKIQLKLDSDSDVSGRNITKLINQNEADMQANDRATIQAAAAEQLTKYGESGDVEALASAITKLTAGENLSRSERALIDNSEYGQRVANELAPENIDSGEYNTGWAETLGTDRINAEAYSRLLQDAQVETEQQPVDTAPVVENIQQSPTVRETAEVTSPETPTSQTVKSSLPASDTQADTKSSVKDLSTKYGKQAGAFIHTYQQGQDIKKYDEAYSNAYDYGKSGVPFSTVKGLEGVAYLTEKQQELAYDAGTAAANDEAVAKAKDRTSRANGKTGRRIGAVKLEGAPASSLNEQQKRATRVLRTVAEATGVDIVLYKSDVNEAGTYEGANGRFDPKSPDKIYIDLNSGLLEGKDANDIGKYAMLRTFSHEFVHFVEFWNSVRYNELRKLVFEEITAHGENVNDLIDTKIEETGLSYERASREVVAEAMTDILPDSKFVQNMAENHKSLFNKLLEKLKEFAADIRAYFKTIGSNRDAGAKALKEQVGETVKYLDSIIDMFDTAATEAVETFQKAYAVDETEQVADKLENAEASTVSEETETAEAEAAQVKPEPKTTTSEHGYTVADNTEYGSVEVKFNDKPSEAVRDVLKANKFRWNKAKKVWYGKTSHDAIVDALNKAYEAESSPEAKSDFMKSWERATQAEKDEVVDAIYQNTKLSYIAPTEIREEIPAQAENITEVNDNGAENEINEGAVHSSKPDGDGAARLLDELQAGDVQRAGGQREAVASAEDRGRPAERDGDRADTSDRSGGSERDGQSRDLQRGRGDDGQRRVRGDRAGQTEQGALGELLRTEESAERSDERGRVTQEEQKAKSEKLRETVSEQIEQQSTESPKGSNFVIGESLNLPTGEKSRFRANIDAIKLIKQLEDEGRNATAAEQEVLSKYVGWGGLSNAFGELRYNSETHRSEMMAKTGWEKEFEEFRQLVTDGVITEKEYQGMSASTKNAHYTSVEVIKAMYDGLDQLGFKGGRMLEPSSGVGNFVGGMPVGMSSKVTSWTMVELDRITGLIAKYLYPQANVRIQGFEAANIPDNYMDVAIGNVPFGNYGVVDRNYPKRITKAIHNYFFAKTLDKVRPGGIVMFITSSFTMNGQDTAIRQYIMDRADLLGAIRLPNTAFAGNAGTEVVTDILVLKKRAPGTEYAGEAFLEAPSRSVGESWQRANVNEYFDNHPEMVLGNAELARGMYGANTLTYTPFTDKGSLGEQIREAFKNITGKMDYTAQVTPEKANFAVERANKKTKQHGLEVKEDGVYRNVDGHLEKVSSDKATTERVSALLGVRDAYRTLVNYLQQGQDAKFVKQARKSLNKAYDDFVKKYGPINSAKNKSALAEDPDQYSLLSLENYDAKKKTATKADIFTKDTITANKTVTHVDDVATGVIVSINRTGGIDTALIAKITDSTEEAVTRQLIDSRLAFKTKNGELEAPETYLSGNVRAKLREAEALVPYDSDYKHNVEELKKVIPQDIPFNDIYVTVGSPWIPNNLYADFIAEMLGGRNMETAYSGPDVSVGRTSTGEFKIVLNNKRLKSRYQNTQKWGTSRKSFLDIMDCLMSSTGIKVNDYVEDDEGRRKPVLNKVETAAAQEKAEAITKEFQEWLWRDENRRNELSSLYNETFNALVTPKYNGANLTVNGLNAEFTLREHQANAVQRIISSGGNTLLAHRVGAGKTLEMAAAAMKLRELGIVKKPVFVVPKSLVAQWGVEFKSYFPAARLLVSDEKSFTTANRKVYSNRIANGDYDAVILSYEQFEKIPMSAAYLQDFYQQQIDEIIDAIAEEKAESRDGKGLTVKEMEKKKAQLEKKIAELTSKPKDEDNIDFEQLGIDSLFVDEAHNFKNLQYTTRMNNVSGLSNSNGSQRAFDLYAKVRYLQSLNGGRGIVFATATPVMNSMAEMYIMQKYLQSDMLEQLGLKTFDAWAKQFGEVVNSVEIKPSGQGFRVKQTFSNFRNLSELQLLFRSFSDVLTQVPGLKIPKMKGGKVKTIVCEPGEFQRNYMKLLEERADNVKNVDPSEDNMLKITSDGRKVSYTQRMIDPSLPYEPGCKLYRCCDNVLEEYKASNEIKGTQIIFCDMATPKGKSKTSKTVSEEVDDDVFDTESAQLYDDMRAYLVKRGIPKKEIAFIHEADTDAKKKQLFADVNDGKVRVLIGSTGKMGVGMNAQKRIVAIHHLDAPWRPGDVEQRDGRAFRQKNMNDEVSKYTYVTEGSFDARLWDILDRKQHFIDQIMNGEDVGRSAEDTGEVTLSAAEVKALASGNPMIMEQVQLSTDLAKLQDLKRAYNSSITAAKAKLLEDEQRIATLKDSIAKGKQDIKATVDTYSDGKFSMTVGKRKFSEKKDAGKALASEIVSKAKEGEFTTVGKFAGFELRVIKQKAEYIGTVVGAQNYRFNVYPENSTYMVNHIIGVIQGIEHKIGVWSDRLAETKSDLAAQEAIISSPFAKQAELEAKTSRFNEVMSILNPKDEQVIGDEGDVQYQARKPLDDELPMKHNKKSTYSETETLFMQWENGSAPIGEVKRFSRFGKFRYYEKTKKGSIELSRDQYNERRKFDAQNTYTRVQRQISEATDYNEGSERNMLGYSDGNRNAGGAGVLSRQTVWETLRHDATGSVRGGVRNSSGNDVNSPVSQAISSAKTSIMQIPALFKHKAVKFGDVNIDIGGGRFDLATNYLASIGTTNLVFDPFNRPETKNASTLDYLRSGKRADTATCANVLNVIAEEEARKNVILEVAKAIKPDGVAYFMVYEGNGTGIGKETSAGYQNNRKTADYVQEISQWFDSVQRSGKLITATKPKANLPKAAWELSPGNAVFYQQRTSPLTDREVLSIAASEVNVDGLDAGELDALRIFQQRLESLYELEQKRVEEGQKYREQQFGANVDREEAQKTLNRMKVLDEQIKRASSEVLDVEKKEVLKRVLQRSRRVIEKAEREHGQELLKRYRDRRKNAADIKKYRDRIKADTDSLTQWILHPNNKNAYQHVPDALKNSVIPFLTSIDFTSKQRLRGGEATKADKEFITQLNKLKGAIKQNIDVRGLYSGYNDLPEGFMDEMQNLIDSAQALAESKAGEFVINRMTAEELKTLSKLVRVVKKLIIHMNAYHQNAMFQHVYEGGDNSIEFMSKIGNATNTGAVSEFLMWQQMRPAYAFERFGKGGEAIYDEFRRGQATLAFNTVKIKEFSDKTYTDAEVKAWEKETKTFVLGEDTVKIPVSYLMGFYELSKQKDSLEHILGEGIRVATYKNGKEKISDVGHALTPGDISTMIKALTPRQMEVADKLQKFMSTQGAEWGNYVSVARFGEELFTNPEYYPINSDGRHLEATADEHPSAASLYALLNMSFTKSRKEGANNRIVLYSIFDVFANHMSSMAQYNAFALPILDSLKWFNYQQVEKNEDGSKTILGSVREQMARVYGVPEESRPGSGRKGYAENFVIGIIKAFNGTETQGIPTDMQGLNAMHKYNMAQVAYNVRVVLQQPMAITRAGLLVDYKNIIKGLRLSPSAIKKNIEEMHKYSGIAVWKSLGFYDINISRGLTDIIKHNDNALDKIGDIGMWGAEKADLITWAAIWSACKDRVMRDYGRPTTEEYYAQVTKLFEDVIYKTQVVDSVLTKNEWLRSKGAWARLLGSFMSEPTTTASMLLDAYYKYRLDLQRGLNRQQAWKLNGRNIGRTAYVYAVGAVLLAAIQAVADAWRDDDDYQTFIEKWLEAFGGNLVDELMPFNKLPILRDFYELVKSLLETWGVDTYGTEPRSVIFQWRDYLVKSSEIFHDKIMGEDTNYEWYGGAYKLLQAVSGITGLPMAAVTREIIGAWNNIVGGLAPSLKVKTYDAGTKGNIKYAYQDGYLTEEEAINELIETGEAKDKNEAYWIVKGWETGESKYAVLEGAVRANDSAAFRSALSELTANGVEEKAARSKAASLIADMYNGTDDEPASINRAQAINMFTAYAGMERADAETRVEIYDWQKQGYDVDVSSVSVINDYKEYCEPSGISKSVYYDAYLFYKDAGVTGEAYSKTKECIPYIDSLPLSSYQKTQLALCWWSEKTVNKYKTWS